MHEYLRHAMYELLLNLHELHEYCLKAYNARILTCALQCMNYFLICMKCMNCSKACNG